MTFHADLVSSNFERRWLLADRTRSSLRCSGVGFALGWGVRFSVGMEEARPARERPPRRAALNFMARRNRVGDDTQRVEAKERDSEL